MNHQSAYCINERPESITLTSLSNLVKLSGTPDVGKVYHKTPTSSKPLSRSQRCFNQFDRETQTRHDGSVNKNQPCSQCVLMVVARASVRFRCSAGWFLTLGRVPGWLGHLQSISGRNLQQDSAVRKCSPNMARHEQGTLTVGIQHGQSRRYA